jgi:isorenieratene synthase
VAWAARTGGSVIEAHAYAIPPDRLASDEVLRERLWEQIVAVLPQLQGATRLAEAFMRHEDFTRFAPGDRARRPGTRTPLGGLVLAGDWVRIDAPVFLMEAAVTSGRLAANAVFAEEGLAQDEIPVVAFEGPLAL